MGRDSRIEWTHHTFNPWWGCVKVSPACDRCYAESWAKRVGSNVWGPDSPRRFFGDAHWREPLRWNREAEATGTRRRVFCASMADVFENRPDLVEPRERLFDLIEATPMLEWLLLTKRIHLVNKLMPRRRRLPANVWIGATIENDDYLAKRIWYLLELDTPAVRFVSCEPLLSPLNLAPYLRPSAYGTRIDWVIAGGESGHGARPMHPAWVEDLRRQCAAAGVPFFFKQWGHWAPVGSGKSIARQVACNVTAFCEGKHEVTMVAVGKSAAGRLLDGLTFDQVPGDRASVDARHGGWL